MIQAPDDPIAALATPLSPSALAVVRVSGAGSLSLLSRLARGGGDLSAAPGHTAHLRVIRDGENDLDQVLITVFQAPKSYTGEEGAEIACHGSLPAIRGILSLLYRSGFRPAGPGEFTQRAFLNGRMDLTRAEAVNEIVRAQTDRARGLALQRLGGAIESRIRQARGMLVDLRAAIEVMIDYPEEDLGDTVDERALAETAALLEGLARTYRRGRIFQEGITVAIAGATNAGKSSLFNALLRQDRAIVSEVHGTTRDYIEGGVSLEGIPVRLFDTAGLRDSEDPLEREGIRRTRAVVGGADVVAYLVDSTLGLSGEDERFLAEAEGDAAAPALLRVWNKIDAPPRLPAPRGFLPVSAVTGEGIEGLEAAVVQAALRGTQGAGGEPLIDSERQRDLIEQALAALGRFRQARAAGTPPDLLAVDLADALSALGEITGEVTSAEILERMFSAFCVGK